MDIHQDDNDQHKELQLLPAPNKPASNNITNAGESQPLIDHDHDHDHQHPIIRYKQYRTSSRLGLVDLQLSISVMPRGGDEADQRIVHVDEEDDEAERSSMGCVEALKWEAAEQIRMAAMEKAYAERVRELTRREMELAQSEFARARHVWERAREEVERAERLKERATATAAAAVGPTTAVGNSTTCMEITCQSCRQRFRPN